MEFVGHVNDILLGQTDDALFIIYPDRLAEFLLLYMILLPDGQK
jgi:hypothetical protein